jgi:hypothetical protein
MEIARSSAQTVSLALECHRGPDKLHNPRTSLAIFNGIKTIFPDEVRDQGEAEALKRVADLTPVLFALNEMTDIGIPVDVAVGTIEGAEFVRTLTKYLASWREEYLKKYPGHRDTVTRLVNDFCLLALSRKTITTEQIPNYLELDSGIFEEACVRVATKSEWKSSGNEPTTFDELLENYSGYLIHGTTKLKRSDNKMRGLHSVEMIMKIDDDMEGKDDDAVLGLPSYWRYAMEVAGGDARLANQVILDLKGEYTQEAVSAGFSGLTISLINLLRWGTSRLKANKEKMNGRNQALHPIHLLPKHGETTTTLRHGLLVNPVFRGWLAEAQV